MAICDSDAEDRAALNIILNLFPGLSFVEHELTSRPSRDYNCIAFALGEADCNWWPMTARDNPLELIYWPRRFPREETIAAFKLVFESKGFFACAHANFEDGFEKIALYCDANAKPTHAARQITSGSARGQWQSIIGREADIRHETLAALEFSEYGIVIGVFARKVNSYI